VKFRPLVVEDGLLEDVLDAHRSQLGRDFAGYRGHVYRTFNFARALAGYPSDQQGLALTAAFHDLGIWSDHTFDYLPPSARRAVAYARARNLTCDVTELERSVLWHHKLTRCASPEDGRVDAFRRADWVDVSWGILRFGLPAGLLRDAQQAFPNAGFHRCLLRVGLRWALSHPTRPLPMLRW
jgi:hypothetical protein